MIATGESRMKVIEWDYNLREDEITIDVEYNGKMYSGLLQMSEG